MQPIHCVVLKWSLIFTLPIRPNLTELKQTSTKLWVCFLCLHALGLLWVCCGHPRADPKQYAPQADPEWTLKADPYFRSRPLNPGDKKNDGSAPHYSV